MTAIRSLILVFLFPVFAFAEVRQAPTMADALEGAEPGSLVVFDLDNTVMMPPQTLGGEEWYDYFVEKRTKEFEQRGRSPADAKNEAIDIGLREWNQFHRTAKVVPVEKDTPALILELQRKGVMTMALTARPADLGESTIAQLKSIGIDFSRATVAQGIFDLPAEHPAVLNNGVFLVGPKNNKGTVLVTMLRAMSLKPTKVIFVDNKQHHVDNVEKAMASTGIKYYGRRHGAADKKIAGMDKDVVEIQHKFFFGAVLSDDQARKLLK